MTVPETNTGRLPENGKARERNLAKELGKLTPYVRNKGSLEQIKGAVKRLLRLFSKNTGPC